MMHHILVYAFQNNRKENISGKIANNLKNVDTFLINCTTNKQGLDDCQKLLSQIRANKYKYILGIGIQTMKNCTMKWEQIAKNKFRNDPIVPFAPDNYNIGEFIDTDCLPKEWKVSEKMGNSWCNLTAYLIRHNATRTSSRNGFIHIINDKKQIGNYSTIIQELIRKLT